MNSQQFCTFNCGNSLWECKDCADKSTQQYGHHRDLIEGHTKGNSRMDLLKMCLELDRNLGEKIPGQTLPTGIPKSLTYNGTESEDWNLFWRRALEFIKMHSIGGIEDQQYYISYMLTGAAFKFFNRFCFSDTLDLYRLTSRMEVRFGNQLNIENDKSTDTSDLFLLHTEERAVQTDAPNLMTSP